jgi:hypothetical protein
MLISDFWVLNLMNLIQVQFFLNSEIRNQNSPCPFLPQGLKPRFYATSGGTAEAVPYPIWRHG